MQRTMTVAVTVLVAALTLHVPAAAFTSPSQFLPPIAPDGPGEDRSERCGPDGLECVRFVEAELAGWEERFGCDHRAVFATVYRLLTRQARLALEEDPSFFDDPAGLGYEALLFYELYEQMLTAHLAGDPIPPAWQTAMDVAQEGDWTAGHDMLQGINAHVQRDMPFAVAAAGLNVPDGSSRKADHDRFNQVLNESYPTIVAAVAERYDPFMQSVDETGGPADDEGSMQMVAQWREGVWRHAEQLVTTHDTPAFDVTVQQIEANAETWATGMANGEVPGRRELRRAHCEAYLAARSGGGDTAVPTASGETDSEDVQDDGAAARTGSTAATGGGMALLGIVLLALALVVLRRR